MNPLKWLRAKAKRKPKLATGGYVAVPTPIVLESCHRWPADMATPAELPDGLTFQMRGYTEMTVEEWRQYLDTVKAVMGQPVRDASGRDEAPAEAGA